MKLRRIALGVVVCAGLASAQDFNIDFDVASGVAATAPFSFFAGAGQPGFWNAVPAGGIGADHLFDRNGNVTDVAFRRTAGGGEFAFDNPFSNGEAHFLLDDIIDVGPVDSLLTLRLEGLLPGAYEVITYAIAPDSAASRTSIFVPGSTDINPQEVGGEIPENLFIPGVTHALHTTVVETDGILALQATTTVGFGSVNGMQVRLLGLRS